jgi:uncharacterized protein YecT (DUF1311 family)
MEHLNSQRGIASVIVVVALAIIFAAGVGSVYYFKQHQEEQVSEENIINETTGWNNVSKNFFYADSSVEKELNQCFESNSSTLGMSDCYGVAIKEYDAILDRVYGLTFQDPAEARVADAKRFFDQYREITCSIAYDEAQGGSIRVLLHDGCYLQVTRAQIQTLCSFGAGPSRCEGEIQL